MSNVRVKVRATTRERPYEMEARTNGGRIRSDATAAGMEVILPVVKTTAQFMAEKAVSQKGQWYVFSDYYTDAEGVQHPGVKIGDGKAYIVDLPFVSGVDEQIFMDHVNDNVRHITQGERKKWNEEIQFKVEGENLIMTRSETDG